MAVTSNGFTKKQLDRLNELFSSFLPAPLPAPPPSALPSEPPHLQSTSAPPIPTRSYPPSPSVETIEEVEYPLQVRQMRKKHGVSKKTRTSRSPSAEIYIGWPTKFGGSNMRRSRDEDLDAWYTTMLNHTQKLAIWATKPYRIRPSAMQADATIFLVIQFDFFRCLQIFSTFRLFRLFNIATAVAHSSLSIQSAIARRLPCPIRSADNTIYKWFLSSLSHTSLSLNPDFQRRNLGNPRTPVPPTPSPTNAGYAGFYWPMVCMMECARRWNRAWAMRALLFFLFCGHVVTISLLSAGRFGGWCQASGLGHTRR